MRILTVLAGLIVSACGAFCFAVYTNPFTDVAFVIGMVMVLSGAGNIITYLISGKSGSRMTETTLVEGLVTLLYGFTVLNNQVTDVMLTLFFGTWLTVCGVTRFSQSLYISRINPKDWAKILPLSAIATMFGLVMMMPKLVSAVMPLMLVGGAFLVDGLSMLIFAMYMKRTKTNDEAEQKAKERAQARKEVELVKRQERDRLRNLSKQERDAELERQRQQRAYEEDVRRKAKEAQKQAKAEAARAGSDRTMEITPDELVQINAAAEKVNNKEKPEEPVAEAVVEAKASAAEKPAENVPAENVINVDENNPMAAIWATMAKESGSDLTINKVERVQTPQEKVEELNAYLKHQEPQTRPVWQKPTDIPSLRSERAQEKTVVVAPIKVNALNLEEIESKQPNVEFEKVELPEVKLASENRAADRKGALKQIDKQTIEKEKVDYTPISLDDLVAEPLTRPYNEKDAKRFTQTLNFGWLEDNK